MPADKASTPITPTTQHPIRCIARLLAIAAMALPAAAQIDSGAVDPSTTDPDLATADLSFTPDWSVRFEPSVGYFTPSGDFTLPAVTSPTPGLTIGVGQLNIDSPRLGPYLEVHAARERWRLTVSGFGFGSEQATAASFRGRFGDAPIAIGDRLRTDFDYSTFSVRGGYRFWSWRSEGGEIGLGLDALLGLRLHAVDIETRVERAVPIANAVDNAGFNETFAEPLAGIMIDFDYKRIFGVEFYATGGTLPLGDRSSTTFDVGVGFTYRPIPPVGFQVGYRIMLVDFEEGDRADAFAWDGSIAGLYWGLQLSF